MLKIFDKNCEIISNDMVNRNYFKLKIKTNIVLNHCIPGQFFMIGIPGVFLRRPMCIYDVKNDVLTFLYKVVGDGTKKLSIIKSGVLKLLGPLGNGYDLKKIENSKYVAVVGGIGIVPINFLANKLKNNGILYYGVRSKYDILDLNTFKKKNWEIMVSTEDGSEGYNGYITDLFRYKLKLNYKYLLITSGPNLMLNMILKIAAEKHISGFVSFDARMACGLGNCQSCAIKIKNKIKMVCKDGPVFKIDDINFKL
jgi:dihydroorotate dehydrogenase electron transfer subunit